MFDSDSKLDFVYTYQQILNERNFIVLNTIFSLKSYLNMVMLKIWGSVKTKQ